MTRPSSAPRSKASRSTPRPSSLPETRAFEWGACGVRTLVSQYLAFLDGRIEEAALDYYAQADDGSVWYFGEAVFDYNEAGLVDSNLGSWLTGTDGPPAMIMPAAPHAGEVYRAENLPSIALEEVSVSTVDKTVNGSLGPVRGAMVGRELHDDGTYSDKVFAPGYGEFYSAHQGDVEALALALPTDASVGPPPPELEAIAAAASDLFDATRSGNWQAAASADRALARAWTAHRRGGVPPRIAVEMNRAFAALGRAIGARNRTDAANAAIDVAQSAPDIELRYRPPAEIDQARFEL